MKNYQELIERYARENDTGMIKSTIVECIKQDASRGANSFQELVEWTDALLKRQGSALYEPDDGLLTLPPQQEWNATLLDRFAVELMYNFSREKIEAIGKIITHLSETEQTEHPNASSYSEPRTGFPAGNTHSTIRTTVILTGAAVGLTLGAGMGLLAFSKYSAAKWLLPAAGSVAGGAASLIISKRKRN